VVALKSAAHLVFKLALDDGEESHERRPDEGYGVLSRHGVIECGRGQDALAPDKPRLTRGTDHRLEDAIGMLGSTKPLAHLYEHRVHEAWEIEVERACSVLPPRVEREGVDGLAI